MRVVVALGGNALLERGEVPASESLEAHVAAAVAALVPLAAEHELVVTHGNGPQVGLLALESAADPALPHPYPLDVLGAETQGMIGYLLLRGLASALPDRHVTSLVCQTVVDRDDPAFEHPTKFVGPLYDEATARRESAERGWQVRRDGTGWRRVVASPEPREVVELWSVRTLLEAGAVVVCLGGGGAPVARAAGAAALEGVEAVIDKDLAAGLLATQLAADLLVILTDVPGVELGFGRPDARLLEHATPSELRGLGLPAGSMGPKVEAACRFVEATGRRAAIGRLDDALQLARGTRGTAVVPGVPDRPGADAGLAVTRR